MKKYLFVIALLCLLQNANAQAPIINVTDSAKNRINLDEVVISSSNYAEKKKNIAQKIDVISSKTIA